MSVNRVVLIGNLTRDPELRSTGGGLSIVKMGIAVNDRRKNQQTGEWEDVPNFFDVVAFGQQAEKYAEWFRKGNKVAVDGKLRWSQWETPEGEKRSKVEVMADWIESMSGRDSNGSRDYDAPSSGAAAPVGGGRDGEEIPF